MLCSSQQIERDFIDFSRNIEPQIFAANIRKNSIQFPLPESNALNEQVMLAIY